MGYVSSLEGTLHGSIFPKPPLHSALFGGYMSRILSVAKKRFLTPTKPRLDGGQYVLKDACLLWIKWLKRSMSVICCFYWYAFVGFGWKGVFYIGVFWFLCFGGPSSLVREFTPISAKASQYEKTASSFSAFQHANCWRFRWVCEIFHNFDDCVAEWFHPSKPWGDDLFWCTFFW